MNSSLSILQGFFRPKSEQLMSINKNDPSNLRGHHPHMHPLVGSYDSSIKMDSALPGVVKIKMYENGVPLQAYQDGILRDQYCSATVISQSANYSSLLTAAHCLNKDKHILNKVEFNNEETALYCVPNPEFNITNFSPETAYLDYAVCVTSKPISSPLINACPFNGNNIQAYDNFPAQISGYGLTGYNGHCTNLTDSNGLSSQPFLLNETHYIGFEDSIVFLYGESDNHFYPCSGDSGGAGLVSIQNGICQLAISSGGLRNDMNQTFAAFFAPRNKDLECHAKALSAEALIRRDLDLQDHEDLPEDFDHLYQNYEDCQPSSQPTEQPSSQPTNQPTGQPSSQPTEQPSSQPTNQPTGQPSSTPTEKPTSQPTNQPTPLETELTTLFVTDFPTSTTPSEISINQTNVMESSLDTHNIALFVVPIGCAFFVLVVLIKRYCKNFYQEISIGSVEDNAPPDLDMCDHNHQIMVELK